MWGIYEDEKLEVVENIKKGEENDRSEKERREIEKERGWIEES
jgi:hypothetical protein